MFWDDMCFSQVSFIWERIVIQNVTAIFSLQVLCGVMGMKMIRC